MNELNILINTLCPKGVDVVKLNEIATVSAAGVDKKINNDEEPILLLNYMDVYNNRHLDITTPSMRVTASKTKISQCNILCGDIFFTPSSEIINDIGNSAVAIEDMPGVVYSYHIMRLRLLEPDLVTSMFVNYVFESNYVQDQINRSAKGITRYGLTKSQWEKIEIPFPPYPIQREIVRILDKFTELTAELTAELAARKQQYQHYKNLLLDFDDNTARIPLGEILKRSRGTNITAKKMEELHDESGQIRIFAGGKTFADVNYGDIPDKDINKEPSIIVKSRGNIEFEYYDKPFSHKNEFWSYYSQNDAVSIKFAYYYLSNNIQYFQNIGNVMQMPQISIRVTDRYLLPVPPLKEQERIVSILDRFDTLVNDISEGLPAEIEARQKQYEYYRDKLLNFKEKKDEHL